MLLLLFGAGYQDADVELRTEFVGPEGSVYEQAVTEYADQLEQYIDPMGFTSDEDAAVRRLEDGELDAVVVFPPDALDQILAGESAKIEVLHEKLDPFQQAAIEIASRLAVQEVNASVLGAIAGGAQDALAPVDQAASELTEQAAALSAAVAAGDTAAMADDRRQRRRDAARRPARDGRRRRTSFERLGGEPDAVGADVLAQIDVGGSRGRRRSAPAAARTSSTQAARAGGDAGGGRRGDPRRSPRSTRRCSCVRSRPTRQNIAPVEIEPVDYFAPSSIALLLQHLALTFAALSLVRDRELGLLELLRVGPLSSVRDPRRQDDRLPRRRARRRCVAGGRRRVRARRAAAGRGRCGSPPSSCSCCWRRWRSGMVLSMISGSETQAVQYAMLSLLAGMFFSGFFLDVSQLATAVPLPRPTSCRSRTASTCCRT